MLSDNNERRIKANKMGREKQKYNTLEMLKPSPRCCNKTQRVSTRVNIPTPYTNKQIIRATSMYIHPAFITGCYHIRKHQD